MTIFPFAPTQIKQFTHIKTSTLRSTIIILLQPVSHVYRFLCSVSAFKPSVRGFFGFFKHLKTCKLFALQFFTMGSDKKTFLITQNIMSKFQDNKPVIHKRSFLLPGSATEYLVYKMLRKRTIPSVQLL